MRVFVTGASGWIGSATVAELLAAGHQVLGLARSDAAAATITAAGADVHRGGLDDLESLRTGAESSDGVVHLAYVHDFSRMEDAARTDLAAVETIGDVLAGTDRPFLIASGVLGLATGRAAVETDHPDVTVHHRLATAQKVLALADRGVRSAVVRFAPTVHGAGGDHGFVATLAGIAREKGVSAYIGDGANHWPAVHRLDAGRLVRLGVDAAPAGSVLHAVAEEGVPTRVIAEALGRSLDLPVASVGADEAGAHFGWIGAFFAADAPTSSELTRKLLDWTPTGPTIVEDIDAGHYFRAP